MNVIFHFKCCRMTAPFFYLKEVIQICHLAFSIAFSFVAMSPKNSSKPVVETPEAPVADEQVEATSDDKPVVEQVEAPVADVEASSDDDVCSSGESVDELTSYIQSVKTIDNITVLKEMRTILNSQVETILEKASAIDGRLKTLKGDDKSQVADLTLVGRYDDTNYPFQIAPTGTLKTLRDSLVRDHPQTFKSSAMMKKFKYEVRGMVLNSSGRKTMQGWGISSLDIVNITIPTAEEKDEFKQKKTQKQPLDRLMKGHSQSSSSKAYDPSKHDINVSKGSGEQ